MSWFLDRIFGRDRQLPLLRCNDRTCPACYPNQPLANSEASAETKIISSETIKLKKHNAFLVERIDPDFGLLDQIQASRAISWREMEDIKCQRSSCDRNSKLMHYILAKDRSDALIVALRKADQIHIVNYLTANGEYSDSFGGDWPLTTDEISMLDTNHESFVDLMDLTDLLFRLYSSKVINKRQLDLISSKPTSHEKNDALLGILRRRSLRDYRRAIGYLRESSQEHIAEIFERGGVFARVHAHVNGSNVTEIEREIATKAANVIINSSIDNPYRVLELVCNEVIAVKVGQSIVLYTYCESTEKLQQLQKTLISGKFKVSVESWFNSLLTRSQKIAVSAVNVSDQELQKMRKYFTEKHQRLADELAAHKKVPSHKKLNDLPLDILDIILHKSYLHWILNSPMKPRDEEVIRSLISVNVCFHRRIVRRCFKNEILSYLKVFYGKGRKRFTIIRNNKNYLMENIQRNKELISTLISLKCITPRESHLIQRQHSDRHKNDILLMVVRSFNEERLSNFMKCLRQTNQRTVARVLENGGGVIKIKVIARGEKFAAKILHENIENHRSKTKRRSKRTEIEKLVSLSQLRVDGIEILNSHLDGQTVVVWFWCRSQAALEYMKRLYEWNMLISIFLEYTQPSSVITTDVDRNQFQITVGPVEGDEVRYSSREEEACNIV